MLTVFDSILLGFIQGITEFLPISSSGHLILARAFLNIPQDGGMAFDAVLQLATACVVLVYFRKDIWALVANALTGFKDSAKNKLTGFLVLGTVPALLLGLLLEDYMETTFRSAHLIAFTAILGALVMLVADIVLKKRAEAQSRSQVEKQNGEVTAAKSFGVGFFQALAIVPGMSRSGMTISGGYFLGLSKEAAVRFSFLLSVPIIAGSGLLKLIDIIRDPSVINGQTSALVYGAISAAVFGWLAIDFLLRYLKTNTFTVFVVYRLILAAVILSLL